MKGNPHYGLPEHQERTASSLSADDDAALHEKNPSLEVRRPQRKEIYFSAPAKSFDCVCGKPTVSQIPEDVLLRVETLNKILRLDSDAQLHLLRTGWSSPCQLTITVIAPWTASTGSHNNR